VVGVGALDDEVSFNALELFHQGRTLRGCVYGSSDPERDIPVIAAHVRSGGLKLAAMVTDEISLEGLPDAFERMRRGLGGRSLVRFGA
jgi:S-(hydroxymethyl)glutathione dehydrogenase/alcohol dehydrogenase